MAKELDLSDIWTIHAKGPNVFVEVNDEIASSPKASAITVEKPAVTTSVVKKENEVKNPWMIVAIVLGILFAYHLGIFNALFNATPSGAQASIGIQNPFAGVGSGDSRFNGLNQSLDFNGPPARQAFNQGQRPQGRSCDQAKSASQVPQNAVNVQWDEGICAYHYQMP